VSSKKLAAKKLTEKEELFIEEYMKDFNATRAMRDAGYVCNHNKQAYKLMVKPCIKDEIDKRFQLRKLNIKVDQFYVIEKNLAIVEANYLEWVLQGKMGMPYKELKDMPEVMQKMVTSVDVSETTDARSGDKTTIIKFKMMDKTKALDVLGKYVGVLDERLRVDVQHNHSFTDYTLEMAKKLEEEEKKKQEAIDVTPK